MVDHGKLAVLDLGEPGRQIGEKLFILLDAEQQRELTHYVLTRNKQDCTSAENSYAISHTSTPQADVELPLTEIHEGDLYFCLEERKVSVRGKKVDLSAREFSTLYLLLMNRKRVMTFEIIAYHVWGEEYVENGLTAIHNIMSRLRKRLKISSDIPDYIISVRGVGYKFDTIQQKK